MGVNSIRLIGRINGKEVSFLVYSEATHNFMDPITLARVGLNPVDVENYRVVIVDGKKLGGKQCCLGVKITIQGNVTEIDLLIVPLGDSQVILGTEWLKELGPSLWDFSQKTLKF